MTLLPGAQTQLAGLTNEAHTGWVGDDVTKHGGGRGGSGKEVTTKDESGLEVFWVRPSIINIISSTPIGHSTE